MEVSKNWFICSIFYAKPSWNDLIRNVIKPYISSLAGSVDNYFLFFGSNRGEHVTVCLRFLNDKKLNEQLFVEILSQFLVGNPSEGKFKRSPYQYPFADHPMNSFIIHLGFFPIPSNLHDELTEKARSIISRAILEEFYDCEVDDGNIFSMYIYFHLIFLKCVFGNLNTALSHLKKIGIKYHNELSIKYEPTLSKFSLGSKKLDLSNLSESNISIVREIFDEIWHLQETDYSVFWMSEWATHCDHLSSADDYEVNVVKLNELLSEHFDFLQVDDLLQHSLNFFNNILEDIFRTSFGRSHLKLD